MKIEIRTHELVALFEDLRSVKPHERVDLEQKLGEAIKERQALEESNQKVGLALLKATADLDQKKQREAQLVQDLGIRVNDARELAETVTAIARALDEVLELAVNGGGTVSMAAVKRVRDLLPKGLKP